VTTEYVEATLQPITSHHYRSIQICYTLHRTRLYRIFWADNAEPSNPIPASSKFITLSTCFTANWKSIVPTRLVWGGFWFNCRLPITYETCHDNSR